MTNDCAAAGVSCTEGVTPTIPGMASYYIIGDFDAVVRRRVCVGTWLLLGVLTQCLDVVALPGKCPCVCLVGLFL